MSHAGSRLLADLADRTTLAGQLSEALDGVRKPRARHDPGRVLVDMAVAVADGATTISDIAVLADQAALFGLVASDSTCWRLLNLLDEGRLGAVASSRAAARDVVWAQRAEVTGQVFPPARAAGRDIGGLVIDLDASIVICHSEKEQAAPTFKKTFGYHPMLAFCDNTGEFLAAQLRRGNAGSNTAADHITVLDQAVAQLPDAHRHGTPILVRADTAGRTRAFLAHLRGLREEAVNYEFSVGWAITKVERAAIGLVPTWGWADAIDADGGHRDGAGLAELTGLLPARALTGYPDGTRVIVRRERPHPGAQPDAFEEADGWRYTAFATDTGVGQHAWLDARHRAHARVKDRIRTAKDTGWTTSRPGRSRSIKPGSRSSCWRSTCWPGPNTCFSPTTPTWSGPSPRRCATGCCTSPPASAADNDGSGSRFSASGPRPASSPRPLPGSRPARSGGLTPNPRHDQRRERPAKRQAGRSAAPSHRIRSAKIHSADHKISSPGRE